MLLNTETERRQSFAAFALIALASLFCVKALWYVPVVWMVMTVYMQVMGVRVFFASLFGLAVPYWIALPFVARDETTDVASQHFEGLFALEPPFDFSAMTPFCWTILGIVLAFGLSGMAYYYRHNRYDRLRMKQGYNGYAFLFVVSCLLFAVQPQLFWLCMAVMAMSAGPFITRMLAWIF